MCRTWPAPCAEEPLPPLLTAAACTAPRVTTDGHAEVIRAVHRAYHPADSRPLEKAVEFTSRPPSTVSDQLVNWPRGIMDCLNPDGDYTDVRTVAPAAVLDVRKQDVVAGLSCHG